jgi:hypothetical protein
LNPSETTIFDSEPAHEIVRVASTDLAPILRPVISLEQAKEGLKVLQEFVQFYLVQGSGDDADFGLIPGVSKPILKKSGAEKLCDIYGLADSYQVLAEFSREDWDRDPPLFDYTAECIIRAKGDGRIHASALGSANSYESKYRFRTARRTCPKCGKESIIAGKKEYGGGWLCWRKEGKSDGCGAKFASDDPAITRQAAGQVVNENTPDLKNTILKMACKRAKVAAVIAATRSSGLFTQDLDDLEEPQRKSEATNQDREALSKQVEALLTSAIPGTSAAEKNQKKDLLLGAFHTKSWSAVQKLPVQVLAQGLVRLRELVRAASGPAPEVQPSDLPF